MAAHDYINDDQFQHVRDLHGVGTPDAVFGEHGLKAPAPWPRAGRRKDRPEFDPTVVNEALTGAPHISNIDPREVHSTQPSVTRAGVDYYLGDEYGQTGKTFADMHQAGNRWPVVYTRDEDGKNLLLSGHHRATAALLKGEPLRARRVRGPWGPQRQAPGA